MSVVDEVEAMVEGLGVLTPHGRALAAAARVLAADVDDPPSTEKGVAPVAPIVNALRATLDDLARVAAATKPAGGSKRDELADRRKKRSEDRGAAAEQVARPGRRKGS